VNDADAARLIEARQIMWPNTPAAKDALVEIQIWAGLLAPYTVEQATAALLSMKARPFAPNVGEIADALDPSPSVAGLLAEFQRLHALGYSPLRPEAGGRAVPWSHPAYADAADDGLWLSWATSPDPGFDEYAQANRANWIKHEFTPLASASLARSDRDRREVAARPPVAIEAATAIKGIE
jgi:hypothetical protein